MNIDKSIFKAYDIRGIIDAQITPEIVTQIGLAIGSESIENGERNIVVGRDGRLSGPVLLQHLKKGLKQSGCHIVDIGIVPTPLVYYSIFTKGASSGVMITGSHNPPQYNGFKITLNKKPLYGDSIQHLYNRITNNNFLKGAGSETSININDDYINRIADDISLLKKLKIIVDCGNGVAGEIAPKLYKSLGCEVIELFCNIDGNFPNHHPDPSKEKNLIDIKKAIKRHNADLGLAFDGDGDRLGLIDNNGNVIWADRQMMLYAKEILSRDNKSPIVFDVKCSNLLAKYIEKHKGKPIMSRTGHSFIKTKMLETNASLGGEMSGHIFFKDRWYGFDDALYTGARLLEILSKSDKSCADIFSKLPNSVNTPELEINFDSNIQFKIMEKLTKTANFDDAKITTIDGIRADFNDGWGLVRPSNTTPTLVLRFEAKTKKSLKQIQDKFRVWLKQANIKNIPF